MYTGFYTNGEKAEKFDFNTLEEAITSIKSIAKANVPAAGVSNWLVYPYRSFTLLAGGTIDANGNETLWSEYDIAFANNH